MKIIKALLANRKAKKLQAEIDYKKAVDSIKSNIAECNNMDNSGSDYLADFLTDVLNNSKGVK